MKNKSKKTNINKSEKNANYSENNDFNKLNYFMQNQTKALILYYYFIEDIRNKVFLTNGKQSNLIFDCGKCYLIDETLINLHKNIFTYQKLTQLIKNIEGINSFEEVKQNLKKIITKLDKNFIDNLKLKEKDDSEKRFTNLILESDNFIDEGNASFKKPCKYHIINQEIYEYMKKINQNGEEMLKDLKQKKNGTFN